MRLLIVMPRAPYPLRATGLSLRYLPMIAHLGSRHDVDLVIAGRETVSPAARAALGEHCRRVHEIDLADAGRAGVMTRLARRAAACVPWAPPGCYFLQGGAALRGRLATLISGETYDTVLWVTGSYTPYVPAMKVRRLVIDFIDSPTLGARRGVPGYSGGGMLSWYELWKIRRWEGGLRRACDATVYISQVDADVVAEPADVHVVPNGVFVADYSSDTLPLASPNIGFVGNMDYLPNVEAVEWLASRVVEPLRARGHGLTLYVVGRNPVDRVRGLAGRPGVVVTGEVESAWAYMNAFDVCAFPLLRGAGMKNKIVEAMSAGRPVVTTSIGNEGIDARSDDELIVRDGEDAFRTTILELLADPARRRHIGDAGRRFVARKYSWETICRDFEAVLCGDVPAAGAASHPHAEGVGGAR